MRNSFVVVGIGELLWDVFPEGKRLGGAPVNFSYHCHQLGASGYPVSAIGADALGSEIRSVLLQKGVADEYVSDVQFPTGTVQVTLTNGKPNYEICEGVAWDHVPMSGELEKLAQKAEAVCFGSLAQRSDVSHTTINAFLNGMRPEALKIFDVNLRQEYFSKEIIESSLKRSNILKLSDEELPVLADMFNISGSVEKQIKALMDSYSLRLIAYTRGAEGSLLVAADETNDHPGHPCDVIDSVGAGDSFTAAICMGILRKKDLAVINDFSNRVAAFVCMQKGATPVLPARLALE